MKPSLTLTLLFSALFLASASAQNAALNKQVTADESRLLGIFKKIHANPELSLQETETAALIAAEFKANGYEVQTGIGKTGVTRRAVAHVFQAVAHGSGGITPKTPPSGWR